MDASLLVLQRLNVVHAKLAQVTISKPHSPSLGNGWSDIWSQWVVEKTGPQTPPSTPTMGSSAGYRYQMHK